MLTFRKEDAPESVVVGGDGVNQGLKGIKKTLLIKKSSKHNKLESLKEILTSQRTL